MGQFRGCWTARSTEPLSGPSYWMGYGGERTYVFRYLYSPVPMLSEPMFPGAYVPRYRSMFPGFCTLIVVISITRLQILPTSWYDSRLGFCLWFRFRVRVRVRLELQTVFRFLQYPDPPSLTIFIIIFR